MHIFQDRKREHKRYHLKYTRELLKTTIKISISATLIWTLLACSFSFCTAANALDEAASEKGVVVVIGNTKHGSSTIIASLLKEFQPEYEKKVGELPPTRECSGMRATATHATYTLKDKDKDITFVDTRGFGVNTYSNENNQQEAVQELNDIFSTKTIRGILLVVDQSCLDPLIEGNITVLDEISDLFVNTDAISTYASQSLALAITYPGMNNTDQNYQQKCYESFVKKMEAAYETKSDYTSLFNIFWDPEKAKNTKASKECIKHGKVVVFNPLSKDSINKILEVVKTFTRIPKQAFKKNITKTTAFTRSFGSNCTVEDVPDDQHHINDSSEISLPAPESQNKKPSGWFMAIGFIFGIGKALAGVYYRYSVIGLSKPPKANQPIKRKDLTRRLFMV